MLRTVSWVQSKRLLYRVLEPEPRLLMKAEHENKDLHFPNEYGSFIVDLNKSLVTRCPVPTAAPPHSIKNKCLWVPTLHSPVLTWDADSLLRLKILVPTKLIIHLSRFKLICIISNLNVFSTFVSISVFCPYILH